MVEPLEFQWRGMKLIRLSEYLVESEIWVNPDKILRCNLSPDGKCTYVHLGEERPIVVRETPQAIASMVSGPQH